MAFEAVCDSDLPDKYDIRATGIAAQGMDIGKVGIVDPGKGGFAVGEGQDCRDIGDAGCAVKRVTVFSGGYHGPAVKGKGMGGLVAIGGQALGIRDRKAQIGIDHVFSVP